MDDTELDDLLATRVHHHSPRVEAAVAELVTATRASRAAVAEPRRRRRWIVTGVALGAVALTAAGSVTAAQLGVPPFQSTEPGVQRIQQPIPVDYTIESGKAVRCEAFLEYRGLTKEQIGGARAYVAQHNWSGFGQRAYDDARRAAATSAPDPVDEALGDILDREFRTAAAEAVPGVSSVPRQTGPVVSGYAMACPTGQR